MPPSPKENINQNCARINLDMTEQLEVEKEASFLGNSHSGSTPEVVSCYCSGKKHALYSIKTACFLQVQLKTKLRIIKVI